MGTLYASFRLRAVGMDRFDPQFPRCPRKLGFSFRVSLLGIDAEDAVLVAVQGRRHPMRYDVIV